MIYGKICRSIIVLLLSVICLSGFTASAAETPYYGYQYDRDGHSVPAPIVYAPLRSFSGSVLGMETLANAGDIFVENENVYILDALNGSIRQYDTDFALKRIINFTSDGQPVVPVGATGMYRRNDTFYVADPEGERVIIADDDGNVNGFLTRPNTDMLSESVKFSPLKVIVGARKEVYVIVRGVYNGAVTYSERGEFLGYFGSGRVAVTAGMLIDHFWKSILNQAQRGGMVQSVPVEYANFDIDDQNFIFTVTATTQNFSNQVQRFNMQSTNILPVGNYADLEAPAVFGSPYKTAFSDIKALKHGLFAAVESQSGRVFVYGEGGDWLTGFGGIGSNTGMFYQPMAIDAIGDNLIVFDPKLDRITEFSPTEYGRTFIDALKLYNEGKYEQSVDYWQKVLSQNGNCFMAYRGIGKALAGQGKYEEAMEYFKLGESRTGYSSAFETYRRDLLKKFIVPFLLVLLALVAFALVPRGRKSFVAADRKNIYEFSLPRKFRCCMFHPYDSFRALLAHKGKNVKWIAPAILLIWLVVSVLNWQFKGFIFNTNKLENFNIMSVVGSTWLIFAAFCVSNWLFSTMMSGSGKMKEIATVSAMSLIPYISAIFLTMLLSNVFIMSEGVFMDGILFVASLWSVMLMISGMQTIHEFSFVKAIWILVLTFLGIAIMAFAVLLAWSLFQQISTFVQMVWEEISLIFVS